MKILLLGDPSSSHIIKWARGLNDKQIDLYILGLSKFDKSIYENLDNVQVDSLNLEDAIFNNNFISKSKYLKAIFILKKVISDFKPDILHSHYASSYGLLGALANFHPYIISVWGSDVYDFPKENIIKKYILKYNLSKADYICSTSHDMAKITSQYTNKNISVISFGINPDKFKPFKPDKYIIEKTSNSFIIGTIKSLEKTYGIEYLIKAFYELKNKQKIKELKIDLKLLIVGGGTQKSYLENLTKSLGITSDVIFTGKVPYDEVVNYYNNLDIYLALSIHESFGVAVLEASSCEKPVLVFNSGGLPEVVEHGKTGFITNKYDYHKIAEYLEQLILEPALIKKIGIAGRKMVIEKYNFSKNVDEMLNIYNKALSS